MLFICEKLIVCIAFTLSITSNARAHNRDCDNVVPMERGDCFPWHFINPQGNCTIFGRHLNDVVQTKEDLAKMQLGYCMTYDVAINRTYLISCPYDIAMNHISLVEGQSLLLNTTLDELNSFTCDQFNRHGLHCARCEENHGQSIFTMDLGCYSCLKTYSGWGLYLFFELVPLTVFLVVILLLRLSPTKPGINSFVLFSQLIIVCLSLNSEPPYKHVFNSKASNLVKIIKACYGFWNLDFFRSLIPSFCVDDNLNNLEALSFHYISILYPSILTAVAWIIVDLHERRCRLVVRMWKPFRSYLSHYSVTSNPKRTIITFFATVTLLSYTKVIYISANLLNVATAHTVCDKNDTHYVMFLQPDIKYFSRPHAPFLTLALVMLFIFVATPLLTLLLYQVGWIQDRLGSFCVKHTNIKMFVEAFQECYTDGSDGTNDRRLFSVVYLFHRILVVLVLVKNAGSIPGYIVTAIFHGIVVGLLFALKPYKKDAYNYLDILFFLIFAVAFLFAAFVTHNVGYSEVIFAGLFVGMMVPFLYASIRVAVILIKWLKLIDVKTFIQQRRRGYIEITEYGIEQSVSMSMAEQNRSDKRQRTGEREVNSTKRST